MNSSIKGIEGPRASLYYVVTPRWVASMRKLCEKIIWWTRRFDVYYPADPSTGVADMMRPRKFR